MTRYASVTENPNLLPAIDITAPEHGVQIELSTDKKVLWVNIDGQVVLRVSQIPKIETNNNLSGDTPAAKWREANEPGPHGDQYNCERDKLCKGTLTDDELANAVYLSPDIGNLTAAKDRIRWLSRQLVKLSEPQS